MNKKIYINSTACISPQTSFQKQEDTPVSTPNQEGILKCIEPDYKQFIEGKDIRRINRLQKMGISAAMQCLNKAGCQNPDAIIVATGWGCIESTYQVLDRMYNLQNMPINPSAFIQSTHNTIAAQIAMRLQCHNYNNTITNNELPFELALDDAIICMNEDNLNQVLLGCADELMPQLTDILHKIASPRPLPVLGEGSTFFSLSTNANENSIEIKHFEIGSKSNSKNKLNQLISDFGVDKVFTNTKNNYASQNSPHITFDYSTLCGNYPSNTGFGLWFAVECLLNGTTFNMPISSKGNIMLYKESKGGLCSVIIVGK